MNSIAKVKYGDVVDKSAMALVEIGQNPGPAVLGHDPIVVPEARETALGAVEQTGVVSFRDDPALPWLNTS